MSWSIEPIKVGNSVIGPQQSSAMMPKIDIPGTQEHEAAKKKNSLEGVDKWMTSILKWTKSGVDIYNATQNKGQPSQPVQYQPQQPVQTQYQQVPKLNEMQLGMMQPNLQPQQKDNTMLYVGIGGGALMLVLVVVLAGKKSKN